MPLSVQYRLKPLIRTLAALTSLPSFLIRVKLTEDSGMPSKLQTCRILVVLGFAATAEGAALSEMATITLASTKA